MLELWYIFYLALYSYVVLYALDPFPEPAWPEQLLYAWQLSFIVEEIRFVNPATRILGPK